MPNPIGEMKERIVVKAPTESVDAEGQSIKTFSAYSTIWGSVQFLSGRELEGMQKINTQIAMQFTVRYRTDIVETMQLNWRDKTWNIHAILPDPRKDYMALMASKVE